MCSLAFPLLVRSVSSGGQIDKRTLIDNLDMLLLTLDEIVDEGCVRLVVAEICLVQLALMCALSCVALSCGCHISIIFENDSEQVAQRVSQRGPDVDTPLAEQSFSQALETAKNQFIRSLQNV